MKLTLSYSEKDLNIELLESSDVTVLEPGYLKGHEDTIAVIRITLYNHEGNL